MKAILSPAKKMRTKSQLDPADIAHIEATTSLHAPRFLAEASEVMDVMTSLDTLDMAAALKVGQNVAADAVANWSLFTPDATSDPEALPAYIAFDGIAYHYCDAKSLDAASWQHLDQTLCTIDATFGLLKPQDAILPHRMDFTSKVKIDGKNPYAFWADKVAKQIDEEAEGLIINIASAEYSKLVIGKVSPTTKIVQCDFYSVHKGKTMIQSTWAKMARGAMARYIALSKAATVDELKDFDALGFSFVPAQSNDERLVFLCKNPVL